MQVREFMSRPVDCISPDATLAEAALAMRIHNVGMLPVSEFDRVVGILTDRDIVVRAVADAASPTLTKVREIMTSRPVFCLSTSEVLEVVRLMEERRVRRLPVLNRENRLVGIVSLDDLPSTGEGYRLVGEVLEALAAKRQ
ncbi:MAG: CBS domain-containing protein [Elusimicrobia bacterium]|nr:CBS domain-containing protein [Elusimicrobiota bacterium]